MPRPRRPWFRFSLRTLFVLTTLVGCLVAAWAGRQAKWMNERDAKLRWLGSKAVVVQRGPAKWPVWLWRTHGVAKIQWCITGPYGAGDNLDEATVQKQRIELTKLFPEASVEFIHCW